MQVNIQTELICASSFPIPKQKEREKNVIINISSKNAVQRYQYYMDNGIYHVTLNWPREQRPMTSLSCLDTELHHLEPKECGSIPLKAENKKYW